MESWLTKFGFDPQKEADRLNSIPHEERINYLKNELATHELHVIRNHAVSLPYSYWLSDEGRVFTNKENSVELELAEEERGGGYKIGIPRALKLAKDNPGQLVFYYSPIGPASFDYPPHPDYKKSYDDGQLNLIYSDGGSIKDINVPLSKDGEKNWLKEIFSEEYLMKVNKIRDEKEKIMKFITTPQLSHLTIDDFLNKAWQDPEMIVFSSNSFNEEKNFSVNNVMFELRNSLLGKLKTKINIELIAEQAVRNGGCNIRPENIAVAYFSVMRSVMEQEGVTKLNLAGNCGGSIVTFSDLFNFENPVEKLMDKPNLDSNYRRQLQQDEQDTFLCPSCEKPIPKGQGITVCPHCGMTKEKYAELTNQKVCG